MAEAAVVAPELNSKTNTKHRNQTLKPNTYTGTRHLKDGGGSNGGAEWRVHVGGGRMEAVGAHECVETLLDPRRLLRPVLLLVQGTWRWPRHMVHALAYLN